MGAWGFDTFENDAACDWTYDLGKTGAALVAQTLEKMLETGQDYLESDAASCGLAACEVVARWKGKWGAQNSYTESLDAWITSHPSSPTDELVQKALAVIDRVFAPESELVELWEGQDEWGDAVLQLRERIAN